MPVTTRSSNVSANEMNAAKALVRLRRQTVKAEAAPVQTSSRPTRSSKEASRPTRACATYVQGMYTEED